MNQDDYSWDIVAGVMLILASLVVLGYYPRPSNLDMAHRVLRSRG